MFVSSSFYSGISFNFTKINVMSSLDRNFYSHNSTAFFNSLSHPYYSFIYLSYFPIYFITSLFYICYHIPSEPINKYLFFSDIVNSVTYGSPIVPAFIPALSPNERVIANPGLLIYFIHTLKGPTG